MGNSYSPIVVLPVPSVHPHVHGELNNIIICLPLVFRFIPTCMGNSFTRVLLLPAMAVHPHVHGELIESCLSAIRFLGSSPRAWGTHEDPLKALKDLRFIPTCMGNSKKHPLDNQRRTVHPHVHGELNKELEETHGFTGSSPRAWGTQKRLFCF